MYVECHLKFVSFRYTAASSRTRPTLGTLASTSRSTVPTSMLSWKTSECYKLSRLFLLFSNRTDDLLTLKLISTHFFYWKVPTFLLLFAFIPFFLPVMGRYHTKLCNAVSHSQTGITVWNWELFICFLMKIVLKIVIRNFLV